MNQVLRERLKIVNNKTHFGFESVNKIVKAKKVKGVFESVATRYDLMNSLMSGGLHKTWKKYFTQILSLKNNSKILDLASGTGDVCIELSNQNKNFQISLKGQDLNTVLNQSDIVTVHTPGSAESIGENEINKLKDGAVLINCARGGVVNEIALAKAMESGKISFAGVDVFQNEPPTDNTILSLSNASLSPHIGASTSEAQMRVGIELAEKIVQHLK